MEFLKNSNVYATFYKEICMKINCTKRYISESIPKGIFNNL